MRRDDDLDKELRFHIASRIDDLVAAGLTPEEARRRTRLEFGGVTQIKEAVRDQRAWSHVEGLLQDVRLAVRTLRATPVVTLVAVLSLALGIGANAAMFSIVDGLVLRPLPVSAPDRLAVVSGGFGPTSSWTYTIWSEIQRRGDAFDGVLAWSSVPYNLAQAGEMEQVKGMYVSGDFFATLGIPAVIGRTLTSADDTRDGGPNGAVAVISHGFWQRHFAGAASAIGSTLMIERVPYTVVGVTPAGFYGPEVGRAFDVAVPIRTDALIRGKNTGLDSRTNYWLSVMIRLKAGQSIDAATAMLRGMQPQIRAAAMPENMAPRFQAEFLNDPFDLARGASGVSGLRQRYQRPLLTILVVVALVLLIACANIANLQLARTATRRSELGVRVALGASRWRLVRQLMVESAVLAIAGAVAGTVLAWWASRALVGLISTTTNTVVLDLSPDWRVLTFALIVTAATTLLFGAAPAFAASTATPSDALKEHGRGAFKPSQSRTASALVVAQVALALVLVVAAGLFIRTFVGLATLPLGLDSDRVMIVNVNATRAQLDPANRIPFYHQLVTTLTAVPGIEHVSASVISPLSGGGLNNFIEVPGAPPMSENDRTSLMNFVTPGWFATYGTAIRSGRDFSDLDTKTGQPVALVNEAFALKFFPGRNPVGATAAFTTGRPGDVGVPRIVVGVVADAVYRSLRDLATPTMYIPLTQWSLPFPMTGITIGVRTLRGSPMALTRSVASALTAESPDLMFKFQPLADSVNASLAQERIVATLSLFFGALALLLAGLGLYGLISYAVAKRRPEIGLRMALGAAPSRVVFLVLTRTAYLIGVGIAGGAAISVWASRFVAALLYGIEPRDPATLVSAVATLVMVGAIGACLPAYRASRIDPAGVLRES
jgi:putative ABC transport system permease protein